jgi:hypothetical protein
MGPALFSLTMALLAGNEPYVRSHVGGDPTAHCLWWKGPTITYQQSVIGNAATRGLTEFTAVSNSFAVWQSVMSSCGNLTLTEGPRTGDRSTGYKETGKNANTVLFRFSDCKKKVPASDPCWADLSCSSKFDCWGHGKGVLGLTTVSYRATGEINDADIELNAYDFVFTTIDLPPCGNTLSQDCVAADVQNTTTHEIGHLLGLGHTDRTTSTMNALSSTGDTAKREIDNGTRAFVCNDYPKGGPSVDCVAGPADTTPPEPVTPATPGCTSAPGFASAWLAALVALKGAARCRRR